MNPINSSRRSFLSTLAILTSGTLVAGPASNVLDSSNAGNASLKKSWIQFLQLNNAGLFVDLTGKFASQHQLPITGMNNVAGDVVSLPTAGLLAQPSWIHWNKNSNLPDDVVIHFYEAAYPYNRVRSINRFEMQALAQLPAASSAILVKALCAKPNAAVKNTAVVKTKVAKKKATQLIEMKGSAHESLFSDQYIYHI